MRTRKVHRFGFVEARAGSRMIKMSKRSESYSACGQWLRRRPNELPVADDRVFSCLPIEAQCRNCRLNEPRAFRDEWRRITEATDEERTTIEVVLHAFAAFCVAVDESGTHADRGCYHRVSRWGTPTLLPCWCGKSWIDGIGTIGGPEYSRIDGRPYRDYLILMTTTNTWKFQTENGLAIHYGAPTDARGLRLRAECGYTHVNMGDGWLQLSVAIRKVALAERLSALHA